jgi:hypothetical protein
MKEQFKEMVRTKNYPLEWFYHYYHQKGGTPINIHLFMQFFEQFNFNQLLDNVAKSFGLNRLVDKNGVLIAVYEA